MRCRERGFEVLKYPEVLLQLNVQCTKLSMVGARTGKFNDSIATNITTLGPPTVDHAKCGP